MQPANVKIILSNIRTSDYRGDLVSRQDTLFQKRHGQIYRLRAAQMPKGFLGQRDDR